MGLSSEENQQPRQEYGYRAVFTLVGDFLVAHLDCPTESMIRKRIAEAQREVRGAADDCSLCEEMRLPEGYTVVYHGDFLLKEN